MRRRRADWRNPGGVASPIARQFFGIRPNERCLGRIGEIGNRTETHNDRQSHQRTAGLRDCSP